MTEPTVEPLEVRIERRQDAAATRRILESLPEWFGIPEANEHYIKHLGAVTP